MKLLFQEIQWQFFGALLQEIFQIFHWMFQKFLQELFQKFLIRSFRKQNSSNFSEYYYHFYRDCSGIFFRRYSGKQFQLSSKNTSRSHSRFSSRIPPQSLQPPLQEFLQEFPQKYYQQFAKILPAMSPGIQRKFLLEFWHMFLSYSSKSSFRISESFKCA